MILMDLQEKSYIESQVEAKSKKGVIAYVLLVIFGGIGAHRFYFGKVGSGVGMLILTLTTVWFTAGIPTLIWMIVDAFLIPGWIEKDRNKVRQDVEHEVRVMRGA